MAARDSAGLTVGRGTQTISELALVVLRCNDIQKRVAWSRTRDTKNPVGIYSRAFMGLSTMASLLLCYEYERLWICPAPWTPFFLEMSSLSFSGLLLSGKTVAQFGLGRHLSGN